MDKRAAYNADLAHHVATWLQARGCVTTVTFTHKHAYEVHYTLSRDIKPQPPIKIDGSVVFPRGSQEDVILAYLLGN